MPDILSNMDFNQYQKQAVITAIYDKQFAVTYPALGLANEAGEVLGKIKKVMRDEGGVFGTKAVQDISKEIGDVLWYLAALSEDLGLSLDTIAEQNIQKLSDRASRGVIGGNGDDR